MSFPARTCRTARRRELYLPWAIIRLINRHGRVDRIGPKADEILCYTFLPADGVDIIRLRSRPLRLRENAEAWAPTSLFGTQTKEHHPRPGNEGRHPRTPTPSRLAPTTTDLEERHDADPSR